MKEIAVLLVVEDAEGAVVAEEPVVVLLVSKSATVMVVGTGELGTSSSLGGFGAELSISISLIPF
eukprot:CAMPEP_0197345370 /NCGR_PEP_ID=MMETSP0893-20130614/3758_1 /TAXON_ID=44058 ORGANISM="Aureoumbra lagunensis, Strain CCMP1510" /NCGR_SAMPLE_ID=MMETSP0893 /ASSEMBLY_ACC=CAM_ASM_000539 /LENGTH=64 /DNA_ID=CAMNT_0042853055 /DNA_START=488 /DNA_END=682 /DNA_ORIENTATION=+